MIFVVSLLALAVIIALGTGVIDRVIGMVVRVFQLLLWPVITVVRFLTTPPPDGS